MALIEHLEREGWQEFLEEVFRYVLDVLKEDRHRPPDHGRRTPVRNN